MTRADKIRQMDDTQLADTICSVMPGENCGSCRFKAEMGRCSIFDWLREDTDEGNKKRKNS